MSVFGALSVGVRAAFFAACLCNCALADVVADIRTCKAEPDSLKRLTCFDAIQVVPEASQPKGEPQGAVAPIILTNALLRSQDRDLDRRIFSSRVELVPTFRNDTKKTVVAIEHTLTITDAFGEKIVSGLSKLDIRIAPGKTVKSDQLYFWEDNQFIQDEPYDRLIGPVNTGTAKASLTVKKAVFSDGTVETY